MNILIDAHYLDKKKEGNRTFVLSLLKGFKKMKKEIEDSSCINILQVSWKNLMRIF